LLILLLYYNIINIVNFIIIMNNTIIRYY